MDFEIVVKSCVWMHVDDLVIFLQERKDSISGYDIILLDSNHAGRCTASNELGPVQAEQALDSIRNQFGTQRV